MDEATITTIIEAVEQTSTRFLCKGNDMSDEVSLAFGYFAEELRKALGKDQQDEVL